MNNVGLFISCVALSSCASVLGIGEVPDLPDTGDSTISTTVDSGTVDSAHSLDSAAIDSSRVQAESSADVIQLDSMITSKDSSPAEAASPEAGATKLCCMITQATGANINCAPGHTATCGTYADCSQGAGGSCNAWPSCGSEQSCCSAGLCCGGIVEACE
jgi:hypothetical protein